MQQKTIIHAFRTLATIFLFLSLLPLIAVRLSEKGDIVDRNSGWILLIFLMAVVVFIYSIYISAISSKYIRPRKSVDELMNEIKKPNLDKLAQNQKQKR